jgi:hypothetical protein
MANEIKRKGDDGMRTNNPDWREATAIPSGFTEDTEIIRREVKIGFYDHSPMTMERIEGLFTQGLTVGPDQMVAVYVTEEVVTTIKRSKA